MKQEKGMVACVTGASGMIGGRIVKRLLALGYTVRVLSRKNINIPGTELFSGDLANEQLLQKFLAKADMLFHSAAELNDENKMYAVNVKGTERILGIAEEAQIKYLCHISTCGVVGRTTQTLVDEQCSCQPENAYENSKWEAEKLVMNRASNCKVVVLRPTNVVDSNHLGAISLPMGETIADSLKVFLKGAEYAHIVHAEDVAAAAVYFIEYPLDSPQCFFVSCDEQPLNTYAGVWALCKAQLAGKLMSEARIPLHLPLFIPYLFRRMLLRNTKNKGNVHYSSEKLKMFGFTFSFGLVEAIDDVIRSKERLNYESVKR